MRALEEAANDAVVIGRRSRSLVALALAVLLVANCSAEGDPSTEQDRTRTGRTELVLAIGDEPETGFDPTLGWGRHGSPLFQSTLLTYAAGEGFVGDLATSWAVSPDGHTWTVKVRDDVVFSDGEPLTAADVAYTFQTAAHRGRSIDLADLDSAVAVDDATVKFLLTESRSSFLVQLTMVGIVPKHAHDEGYARDPIGSGPFELERWTQGEEMIATRNDNYHGDPPAFERLVFLFPRTDGSVVAARSGEVQIAGLPQTVATTAADGMRLVAMTSVDNVGIALPNRPAGDAPGDRGPATATVTSDVAIRQALNLAIDRVALVEEALSGHGRPAYGPVDGHTWSEPATLIDDDDLEAAASVLAAGGWSDRSSTGVLEKNGVEARFTLLYPATDPVRQSLALTFRDMVAELGVDVEVHSASWKEIGQRPHTDAVMLRWGSSASAMSNVNRSSGETLTAAFFIDGQVATYRDLATGAANPPETRAWEEFAQRHSDRRAASAPFAWIWLVNLDHTYLVDNCIDLGEEQVEPHGEGWPITASITDWRWTC